MRTLILWPPHIPSYFNAGHHLPLFQVSQYLRKHIPENDVIAIDAGVLNYTWKEIADKLSQNKFDFIVLMNDFDAIDTFPRIVKYIRTLSEDSKILIFGRLSKQIPGFFKKFNIDGIIYSGDYEIGVSNFIKHYLDKSSSTKGLLYKDEEGNWQKGENGEFLPSSEWEFPDLNEIPYSAYDNMYKDDRNKFCGIPNRRELVVNVSRGCPVGCEFCDVVNMQGREDRRLDAKVLVDYIAESFEKFPFEYVTFYSPTFTLNRKWTEEFCYLLIQKKEKYPWKCVTTIYHLDDGLIRLMKDSGCVRISIGVETIDENAKNSLPKIKQNTKEKIKHLLDICSEFDIELNCFVILGLPGETIDGAKSTIEFLKKYNARVRPTIYTPYNLLREDMSLEQVASFNRQIFIDGLIDRNQEKNFYDIFYKREERLTNVYRKIKNRR